MLALGGGWLSFGSRCFLCVAGKWADPSVLLFKPHLRSTGFGFPLHDSQPLCHALRRLSALRQSATSYRGDYECEVDSRTGCDCRRSMYYASCAQTGWQRRNSDVVSRIELSVCRGRLTLVFQVIYPDCLRVCDTISTPQIVPCGAVYDTRWRVDRHPGCCDHWSAHH